MKIWQIIIIKSLKILFPVGLIILVVYLIYQDLDFAGERLLVHSAASKSILVNGPGPDNRLAGVQSEQGEKFWTIIIDPVYWQLTLPRRYEEIEIEIVFQAPGVSLVQFGGLMTAKGWNYQWTGLKNDVWENISWPCLVDSERNWRLCQKEKNYQSIERFLLAPPTNKKISNYNFPLPEAFARLAVDNYNNQVDWQDYDYLIGVYQPPVPVGEWWRQTLQYQVDDLYLAGNVVQFALSAPGIDKNNQLVKIKELRFILRKEPITARNFLPKLWQGLKFFLK